MEEVSFIGNAISTITGISTPVVFTVWSLGAYIRGKIKDRRADRKKKSYKEWRARMELEVERQLDFIYSRAYKGMEERVFNHHELGAKTVLVRYEDRTVDSPLGGFRTAYKEAVKETADIVKPCIMNKLENDKERYDVDDNEKYVLDTGEDIEQSFIGTLGRKIGISGISIDVEQDVLGVKVFQDMYGKIIRRARGK